ncbi:MAG: hypothetical protein AABY86_07745, partial [Bdellovibrionota bacterium]
SCFWLTLANLGRAYEGTLDYKQSVKEFSSNDHLKKMFVKGVEQRAGQLFILVKNSISKGEKVAINETLSKRKLTGILDRMEWDALVDRWQKRLQINR